VHTTTTVKWGSFISLGLLTAMPKRLAWLVLGCLTLAAGNLAAEQPLEVKEATGMDALRQIVAPLLSVRPDLPIEEVYFSPVSGLYGVALPDGTTLYLSQDGKHMIVGDMFVIGDDLVNLTEQRRSVRRKELMAQVDLSDMVVFPAQGETKAVINVFTDVDCGYCRKLHSEIAEYGKHGIEVRYLAYPREGLQSETAATMRSVWCASDPGAALTRAKNGQRIAERECPDNPVAAQFALGQGLGVSGTPAIVTAEGELFPGYIPAPQLAQRLGIVIQP
jgi:thiol:disulfide interchange protein DsbC